MRSPASICKHPIHPMLVVFPIGLWVFALACDFIRLAGASVQTWSAVGFATMVGGLIGALGAAIPVAIDLLYYKGGAPPGMKMALAHIANQLLEPRKACHEDCDSLTQDRCSWDAKPPSH